MPINASPAVRVSNGITATRKLRVRRDVSESTTPVTVQVGAQGPQGPPGPHVVSSDPDNIATIGSDEYIYVPRPYIVLEQGEPIPPGTPDETLVFRST